jgi:L-amino acid N-acyltransferase YncA
MVAIRDFTPDDLEAVTRIYGRHVLHGTATFEEVPPSAEDMRLRTEKIRALGLPWLVATDGTAFLGYAYADRLRERSAYRFTLEDSVYIDPAYHRRGAGRALLRELIARCEARGYRQMIAAIGDSANQASIGGNSAAGSTSCSCKGRWAQATQPFHKGAKRIFRPQNGSLYRRLTGVPA